MKELQSWADEVLREAHVATARSLDHHHVGLIETKLRERMGDNAFSFLSRGIEDVLDSDQVRRQHFSSDSRNSRPSSKQFRLRRNSTDHPEHEPLIEALSNGAAEIAHRYGELKGVCVFFDRRTEILRLQIGR